MSKFSERLKDLRLEKNLSTTEMAKIVGTSHATISRWESGIMVPSADFIYIICKNLNISADYLLGLVD